MKKTIQRTVWILLLPAVLTGCSYFGSQGPAFTNWEPALSPDGTRLAFESEVDGSLELFTLELASGTQTQLTTNDTEDWSPTWSPDASQIAFASTRDKNADIYVLTLDTQVTTRLTTHEADDINPEWGEDNKIYFNSNRSDVWEIYVINPDGTGLTKITDTPAT